MLTREERVLRVGSSFRQPGYGCTSCRHLQVEDEGRCPCCAGKLEKAAHVVAEAVEQAFAQEAQVHFVSGDPDRRADGLESLDHIGAILRYPMGGRS